MIDPTNEQRAVIERAWDEQGVPPDIEGSPWAVGAAFRAMFDAGVQAALSATRAGEGEGRPHATRIIPNVDGYPDAYMGVCDICTWQGPCRATEQGAEDDCCEHLAVAFPFRAAQRAGEGEALARIATVARNAAENPNSSEHEDALWRIIDHCSAVRRAGEPPAPDAVKRLEKMHEVVGVWPALPDSRP